MAKLKIRMNVNTTIERECEVSDQEAARILAMAKGGYWNQIGDEFNDPTYAVSDEVDHDSIDLQINGKPVYQDG